MELYRYLAERLRRGMIEAASGGRNNGIASIPGRFCGGFAGIAEGSGAGARIGSHHPAW